MNQLDVASMLKAKFPDAKIMVDDDYRVPGVAAELNGERCEWTAPHHRHWAMVLQAATSWLGARTKAIGEPADASTSGAD